MLQTHADPACKPSFDRAACILGGRNGKKRAIIARARVLEVLLHRLWVSGEVYEPLRNSQ
jgi:hypothetical protein